MPMGTQSQSGGGNNFLSDLGGTLFGAFENIINQSASLVPVWAAQQLGLQQQDQLSQPTFQGIPTVPTTTQSAQQQPSVIIAPQDNKVLTYLLIAGGVIVAIYLLK